MKLDLGDPQFIQPALFSSASPLRQAQVEAWVMAVQHLRHAALKKCRVVSADRLPTASWVQVIQLPQYDVFVAVSHAAGLVCADLEMTDPIFQAVAPGREQAAVVEALVATATLPQLRHWVHFLLRAEQHTRGHSSPVVDALRNGRLMAVADRLARDPTLRA
jgi:hypothetical protein